MHIMGLDKIAPAKLTPGVQLLPDGTLTYPAIEEGVKAMRLTRPRFMRGAHMSYAELPLEIRAHVFPYFG